MQNKLSGSTLKTQYLQCRYNPLKFPMKATKSLKKKREKKLFRLIHLQRDVQRSLYTRIIWEFCEIKENLQSALWTEIKQQHFIIYYTCIGYLRALLNEDTQKESQTKSNETTVVLTSRCLHF